MAWNASSRVMRPRRWTGSALTAPIGATQRVGSSTETAWICYYPEMDDLIRTLKKAGIEPKRPVAVRCRSTTCWVSAGRR